MPTAIRPWTTRPPVRFFSDTINVQTGTTRHDGFADFIGTDALAANPIVGGMSPPCRFQQLLRWPNPHPFLGFGYNLYWGDRFWQWPDTVNIQGVNPAVTYGAARSDYIRGNMCRRLEGYHFHDLHGELNAGAFDALSAVGPLSTFVYDNVGRPGEDLGNGLTFEGNGMFLSFATASSRNSRPTFL